MSLNADSISIDTPISISVADLLTAEEREQILQTVETLKAITQQNPDDEQSLEILKDAYWKLGMQTEGLAVTRKLADAYIRLGQYSSAMLEYEGILLHEPDCAEVQKLLAELEEKLHQGKSAAQKASIALDFGLIEIPEPTPAVVENAPAVVESTLIATEKTRRQDTARITVKPSLEQDVDEPLARFLIQHRLAPREVVENALQRVRCQNAEIAANPDTPAVAAGLLDEIIKSGLECEPLIAAILDRTKFAYAPLEIYDIDRQIVKMIPENLALSRRVVPFDIVSRTMMVAIDNPFDTAVKTIVQQSVDYHIQWHLALPSVINRILRDSYRLADS